MLKVEMFLSPASITASSGMLHGCVWLPPHQRNRSNTETLTIMLAQPTRSDRFSGPDILRCSCLSCLLLRLEVRLGQADAGKQACACVGCRYTTPGLSFCYILSGHGMTAT